MEDEESYTVLNLRLKGGNSARLSPAGHQEPLMSVCCYKIALGALGAWCIVVTIAGIVLGAWGCCFKVCQGPHPQGNPPESDGVAANTGSGRECNASLEDLVSRLKQSVCDPAQINSGGAGCKLCPPDWLLRGDKCYWLLKGTNNWHKSREDCTRRGSEMLVIRDREQMAALPEVDHVWIGLIFNSSQKWTWLDGSPVHSEPFPGLNWAEQDSCGVLTRTKTDLETCSSESKWLCQKDAFPL